ncbi:uncharacterized protein LOC132927403 [Rhopalosiphum padi]|uniref:uncharacterized protein LOC132927403 n=1 Tax=Rhopalosiphum padi TaxID=40932 RepID=UPI00298EC53A|nr:uncharacterized protein LOC132927403 [Rhopalosiphum padi]
MTLFLSFFFILSSNVIIFNLPSSQGISSGYHQSTLSQVLTPSERLTYILFGTLPNRIYYSYSKRSYVVRGQPGAFKNDLRTQRGKNKKGYKVMPRWKYYLSKFSPVGLIKTGMEYVSFAKALLGFGRGFKDFDDTMGDMGDLENPDDNPNNDEDSDLEDDAKDGANGDAKDGAKDDAKDGAKDEAKDDAKDGAKDSANNNANGGNNNEKDWSGMFPSLPTFPTDLSSLYGDSNDGNKDNNNDKKEDKNDKKEDDKKEDEKNDDSVDYTEMAKEAMQSDTAKDLVKTGISLFVPGGPAIVAAMEAGSKLGGATDAVEKVPKLKI